MDNDQRLLIELERKEHSDFHQRRMARFLKNLHVISLGDVPLATIYNHIRRFDKRNAATTTAGLEAVTV